MILSFNHVPLFLSFYLNDLEHNSELGVGGEDVRSQSSHPNWIVNKYKNLSKNIHMGIKIMDWNCQSAV